MDRKISYLILVMETILLAIKYKLLKYILSFDKYINYHGSKKKLVNHGLNLNKIITVSSKVCMILKINSCLILSMTQRELLNKRGYKSNLIIGIKNDTGSFESHCWLKVQDKFFTHNRDISNFKIITKI